MGCNCKKTYENMSKYADGGESVKERKKFNIFSKLFLFLLQICFGFLCSVVIIIMIVPMLLYIIGCLITGREAKFNLRRKRNSK